MKQTNRVQLEPVRRTDPKIVAKALYRSIAIESSSHLLVKLKKILLIGHNGSFLFIIIIIAGPQPSTYINATFIESYDNSESFIITQDPMDETIADFWRMISEQSINTIVMISEIGDGPRKCPRYWADDEIEYDHILVKYMHSESCPYYTRREFNVTNFKIKDTIKVTQFQYNGWPTVEGEVPEVTRGMLELVDQTLALNDNTAFASSSPVVVHCR